MTTNPSLILVQSASAALTPASDAGPPPSPSGHHVRSQMRSARGAVLCGLAGAVLAQAAVLGLAARFTMNVDSAMVPSFPASITLLVLGVVAMMASKLLARRRGNPPTTTGTTGSDAAPGRSESRLPASRLAATRAPHCRSSDRSPRAASRRRAVATSSSDGRVGRLQMLQQRCRNADLATSARPRSSSGRAVSLHRRDRADEIPQYNPTAVRDETPKRLSGPVVRLLKFDVATVSRDDANDG